VPTLEALLERHTVAAVVTQPDKPAGRGRTSRRRPSRSARWPRAFRCSSRRDCGMRGGRSGCRGWRGCRRRGRPSARSCPRPCSTSRVGGSINVHASILPRYRGARPSRGPSSAAETETGITTFQMDPGMDRATCSLPSPLPSAPTSAGELSARLSRIGRERDDPHAGGAGFADAAPPGPLAGHHGSTPQEGRRLLRFAEPARDLVNRVRAAIRGRAPP